MTDARPLRADAARNRDKILETAAEVFGDEGTDASLEEIARRAGVGVGTLYRHFPSRTVLVEQVYRHSVAELCDEVPHLAATLPPGDALETWLMGFVTYVGRKRGLATALRGALGDDASVVFADVHAQLKSAGDVLLVAAQDAGVVRTDVETMDVLRAVSGVCSATADAADPEKTRRVLRLLLDGLRYGSAAG
ncbi:TetR/AcrR family transcriptional regulator [Cellulomonas sp. McL0617]|uniref:TetR/AcrR family transcriptional regulator n=1 Tax=Cellulomonas sp. McL0617 TaxID=3415675 RepID=UPI003CF1F0F8